MKHVIRPALVLGVLAVLAVLASLAAATTAARAASSSSVLISQVYGGGGNSGASFQNDFVELLNTGSTAVDLSGYTLQYATAAGSSWTPVALGGSLAGGHYYLVALASGGANGAALPAPDATGSVNLASTGGKVALVLGSTALTCGAAAGSCAGSSAIADLVGYGSAADYEGTAAAPALDSTHAAVRDGAGCADTGDNAADFTAATPTPRNTSSAGAACSGSGGGGGGSSPSAAATVSADVQSALSVTLDQPSLAFGAVAAGSTPPRLPERVTVVSNAATGYSLSVHRSAFTPADLPLGLAATAPAGGVLGSGLAGGALAGIPIAPSADLHVGSAAHATPAAGDVWQGAFGFTSPLPAVPAGHYAATVVFTVVGQ